MFLMKLILQYQVDGTLNNIVIYSFIYFGTLLGRS